MHLEFFISSPQVARKVCDPFLKGLDDTFGTGEVRALDMSDGTMIKRLTDWSLPGDVMQQLLNVGDDAQDEVFKAQVSWIHSMKLMVDAVLPVHGWWSAAQACETEELRYDAQAVEEKYVTAVTQMRRQMIHFKSYMTASPSLDTLFASQAGVLAPILANKFSAKELTECIVCLADELVQEIGETWTQHAVEVANRVTSWCPTGFEEKERRGKVLSDSALAKALLGNEKYPVLSEACNMLGKMRSLLWSFPKDGTALPLPVSKRALKVVEESQSLGVRCVTWTFGLYMVMQQLVGVPNDVARAKLIDDFVDRAKEKGCTFEGSDLHERMVELKKPGAVPPLKSTTGSSSVSAGTS